MALTPTPKPTPTPGDKIAEKVDEGHENKAEAKVADAKENRPTGYAAVGGNTIVTAIYEDDKTTPVGTMLQPITEKTGTPQVGWSWSGEKYYPPAP